MTVSLTVTRTARAQARHRQQMRRVAASLTHFPGSVRISQPNGRS